jgi:hypothetical protein
MVGPEDKDVDRAEQLNAFHEFDYDQTGEAQHDYDKYLRHHLVP